jgi:hypothetical protein
VGKPNLKKHRGVANARTKKNPIPSPISHLSLPISHQKLRRKKKLPSHEPGSQSVKGENTKVEKLIHLAPFFSFSSFPTYLGTNFNLMHLTNGDLVWLHVNTSCWKPSSRIANQQLNVNGSNWVNWINWVQMIQVSG